jgi:hypothetical protein
MKIISSILSAQFEHNLADENEFIGSNELVQHYYFDLRDLPAGNGGPFIINLPAPAKTEIVFEEGHEYPEPYQDFFAQFSGQRFAGDVIKVTMILEGGRNVILRPGIKIFENDPPAESNVTEMFTSGDGLPVRVTLLYLMDAYALETAFPETPALDRYLKANRLLSGSQRLGPIQ